jgi:hypothetical protein
MTLTGGMIGLRTMIRSMGIATAGVVTGARRIGESGQTDDAPPADLVDTYRSTALRRRREDCTLFTQQADRTSSDVQVNVALPQLQRGGMSGYPSGTHRWRFL